MMLHIPDLCFATASVPMFFDTDGTRVSFEERTGPRFDPGRVAVLTLLQAHQLGVLGHPRVSVAESIALPEGLRPPVPYSAGMPLAGKQVLVLMFNGWGDTILLQPAFRALYEEASRGGEAPSITLACNWVKNFPYPEAPFIHAVRPNVMSLGELCRYDVLVNLAALNHVRSRDKSLLDLALGILGLPADPGWPSIPRLRPDPARIRQWRPILGEIRRRSGKRLLFLNWRSRFHHKNAPARLFRDIAAALRDEYQAVLFKDAGEAAIMDREIRDLQMPLLNSSSLVRDSHDTVAALSLVDSFVSVDTGVVHAAGALGIPGVALFGPFPPETHVSVYPAVRGLRAPYRGAACSGPCLETHRGCAETAFSPGTPSPCFLALTAGEILEALEESIERNSAGRLHKAGGPHIGNVEPCAFS